MKPGADETVEVSSRDNTARPTLGLSRGISILDLILRIIAAIGTLASAVAMGTTEQTLPIFSQFIFRAKYNDLPTLTFFVIANSIVCGYLVLFLPLSIFHVIKTSAKISRLVLLVFDTVMLALITAGASAATAIVYLAHEGNSNANWLAICQQFNTFCQRISGSLIGSFGAAILLVFLIIISAVSIYRL
ncbi:casparian strip membrane protein 1-like [Pistacia vera]|nr:casparian strip membrane protein 1-like [Pistacia vera]